MLISYSFISNPPSYEQEFLGCLGLSAVGLYFSSVVVKIVNYVLFDEKVGSTALMIHL